MCVHFVVAAVGYLLVSLHAMSSGRAEAYLGVWWLSPPKTDEHRAFGASKRNQSCSTVSSVDFFFELLFGFFLSHFFARFAPGIIGLVVYRFSEPVVALIRGQQSGDLDQESETRDKDKVSQAKTQMGSWVRAFAFCFCL